MPTSASRASDNRPRVSMKSNFIWTLGGNITFTACQWAVIVLIAKLGTPEIVGQYTLALAIAAPLGILTNFQLRTVYVNDVEGRYKVSEMIGLRAALCAAGLASVAAVCSAAGYKPATVVLVLLVCAVVVTDSLSDTYYGICQRHERMDRIARSLILRGIASVATFALLLYITRSVVVATAGAVTARVLVLLGYDASKATFGLRGPHRYAEESVSPGTTLLERIRPEWNWRKLARLAAVALPLGAVSVLNSLNANVPRYFLERYAGVRALGIFAALNYLPQAGLLVAVALGVTAYPRWTNLYFDGDIAGFKRLLAKVAGLCFAMGVAGVLVTAVAGRDILRVLYRPEYAERADLLLWLVAIAAVACPASALGCALTATSRFYVQIPLFLAVLSVSVASCLVFVPRWGVYGAAFAGFASMLAQAAGTAVLLHRALLRRSGGSRREVDEIPAFGAAVSSES
jgi:O-antigen/teichoic acid export membrane protein